MTEENTPPEKGDFSNQSSKPAKNYWANRLIVLTVASIVLLTFVNYGVCMFRYRWMEWQFYKNLINKEGIEKISKVDIKYLVDPVCEDVNTISFATLTGLLATVLALKQQQERP
jgi:hypothetical protein